MSKDDLLKEELKRHMQLLEYTFYMGEEYQEDDRDKKGEVDDLILGGEYLDEQEEEAAPEEEPTEDPEVSPFADAPDEGGEGAPAVDDEGAVDFGDEEDITGAEGEGDPFGAEEDVEIEDEFGDESGDTGEETIEVDVSDIVDKAEATRTEIEGLTSKMEELMGNFDELSGQVTGMDKVIDKIENLEQEIEKRNPTPVERLEMRSMDSFPYNVSLTDFWSGKEGYEATDEEKEYTLTQDDIDEFSETDIKNSFDYNENDEDN